MALDLALRCGFAVGDTGAKPRVETWVLKKPEEPIETGLRNLACTLRDNVQVEAPDLIAVENFLHPSVQRSADVVITQLRMHGVIDAIAGVFGVRVVRPDVDTVRKHFCGRATAVARTRGEKTDKERAEMRQATKQMVIDRAILLGYLPRGCKDDNKADSVALWDFSCAHYARVTPRAVGSLPFHEGARA